MAQATGSFTSSRPRPRPVTLVLIVLAHVLAIYGLAKAFAPGAVNSVERAVLSTVTVTLDVPPPPSQPSQPEPQPEREAPAESGAAGEAGRRAVPREVVAPKPPVVIRPNPPAPRASATGSADTSGARDSGAGTGAGGQGEGTGGGGSGTGSGSGGAGSGGAGSGGGAATQPEWIGGAINNARDYPVPPGGRQVRNGTEVVVRVTVGTNGRARDCVVFRPSPDPEADRITCRLVEQRLRFRPATDAAGNPVEAPFYWRQRWF